MIVLEWKELDRLEVEGKLERILDFSYNTWLSEQKNICYFVRAFFIRWYLLVDNFDIEDCRERREKLKNMYNFGVRELKGSTEVDWIMGYCMGINPIYFEENDDYLDLVAKGNELLHDVAMKNPDDIFLNYIGLDFSAEENSRLRWKRANRQQLIQYNRKNFNFNSIFSNYFKGIIRNELEEQDQKEGTLEKISRKWKRHHETK